MLVVTESGLQTERDIDCYIDLDAINYTKWAERKRGRS